VSDRTGNDAVLEWCPHCAENCVALRSGKCPWCGTKTHPPGAPRIAAEREKPTIKEEPVVSEWPYSFEILNVTELFVDETYQRPLTNFAARIEKNFDPALVGTLVVSKRSDNRYAVVDGQTRAAAILNLSSGDKAPVGVPCLVYHGMAQSDEASLFARLQKERRGIASAHRFRAAVVAGEPEAIEIEKIANAAGYQIGAAGGGKLSAVAALEKVYRRSDGILERTLKILRQAWPEVVPPGDVIRGIGGLIAQEPINDERMTERLAAVSPEQLQRRAGALSEGMGGGHREKYMALALGAVYRARIELAEAA
jgi:hypothetical protein